jgi:hypothetical protein
MGPREGPVDHDHIHVYGIRRANNYAEFQALFLVVAVCSRASAARIEVATLSNPFGFVPNYIRYTYAVRIGESRKGTQGRLLLLHAHVLPPCMCGEKRSVLKFFVAYGPVAQVARARP